MIDPSILLQSKPVQIETPADAAQQAATIQNLGNAGALQRADLQGVQQQNQGRQRVLDQHAALNQALQKNTKVNPDGTSSVDHNGIINDLTAGGYGDVATEYRQQLAGQAQAQVKLQEDQDKVNATHAAHVASLVNPILEETDPAKQAAMYQEALSTATKNGWAHPGELPDQWNPDTAAKAKVIANQATSVLDQYKNKYGQERVDALTARADAAKTQADAATTRAQAAQDRANQGTFKYAGTRGGKAVYFNERTGEEKLGGALDEDPVSTKGKTVTPDASLAEHRANQTDYEKAATAETTLLQQRNRYDSALASGKVYVDPKGQTKPFSSMKNAEGDALSAADIAALQDEMRQSRTVTQKGLEQAVSNKNNAMSRNGVTPQVSTGQAIANYRGKVANSAQVAKYAKARGISTTAATQEFKASGYTISQ